MLKRTVFALALVPSLFFGVLDARGAADVDTIVRKTNEVVYYQGDDGRARITMTVEDAQGRTRVKEFTILRLNVDEVNGDQMFYVRFHKPADERGVVFMVHKHVDRDDDRWLFLPALDVQRRIAAGDKRTSFAGSHFLYEDVSGRGIEADHHELIEETDVYYVLKNVPKNPEDVEFDAYTMWIHKASFVPVEVKYEKDGEIIRIAKTLAVKEIQGHMTVTRSQMTDLRTGGTTTLDYAAVEYDVGLDESIFTERYLRVEPRQFLE